HSGVSYSETATTIHRFAESSASFQCPHHQNSASGDGYIYGSCSVFNASFSGHPFSRLCESWPCLIFSHARFRFSCRLYRICSRWPRRGVPLLSSMCRASRNLLRYVPLCVFVCWYISICFLVP